MPKTKNSKVQLGVYIRQKVAMLTSDFKILLTQSDMEKLMLAGSEISVDNHARDLIKRRLTD